MNKQHILNEIKRTAQENGGVPLGKDRFLQQAGIRENDWFGKYWSRWGDALQEAGFSANKLQGAHDEEFLIEKYAGLIRELGRLPVAGEVRLKRQRDPSFPSHNTFSRFGSKAQLISRVLEYCRNHTGFDDVVRLCPEIRIADPEELALAAKPAVEEVGAVYLLKSDRYYKIGRTNAIGRREYELAIQLPAKSRTVHIIRTDDPVGIEGYWHARFAAKRANGEWFELDNADVQAFKRRKFM